MPVDVSDTGGKSIAMLVQPANNTVSVIILSFDTGNSAEVDSEAHILTY